MFSFMWNKKKKLMFWFSKTRLETFPARKLNQQYKFPGRERVNLNMTEITNLILALFLVKQGKG